MLHRIADIRKMDNHILDKISQTNGHFLPFLYRKTLKIISKRKKKFEIVIFRSIFENEF